MLLNEGVAAHDDVDWFCDVGECAMMVMIHF